MSERTDSERATAARYLRQMREEVAAALGIEVDMIRCDFIAPVPKLSNVIDLDEYRRRKNGDA